MEAYKHPTSVSFRMATEDDKHLHRYDNTKLVAGETCPTWGVLRYGMHKSMNNTSRAMPLECGSVMHEAFSFVRLCQLVFDFMNREGRDIKIGLALYERHGIRLFGAGRWRAIKEDAGDGGAITIEAQTELFMKRGCVSVLNTSGYYDDPSDKKRTLTNMESAIIAYCDNWNWKHPVWVRDVTDAASDIGVEIPFDVVVTWRWDGRITSVDPLVNAELADESATDKVVSRRFVGKIDGIRVYSDGVRLEENKTAGRLNEAWSEAFLLNTQPTGYCMAASVFTGETVRAAKIMGLCIPLPKSFDYGGILEPTVRRQDHHFRSWLAWFDQTAGVYEAYENNPFDTMRFTHSCSRFFRPCSMIPFCDATREEQALMLDEMATDQWDVLATTENENDVK